MNNGIINVLKGIFKQFSKDENQMARPTTIELEQGKVMLYNFPKELTAQLTEYIERFGKTPDPAQPGNVQTVTETFKQEALVTADVPPSIIMPLAPTLNDVSLSETALGVNYNPNTKQFSVVSVAYNPETKQAHVSGVDYTSPYKADAVATLKRRMFDLRFV